MDPNFILEDDFLFSGTDSVHLLDFKNFQSYSLYECWDAAEPLNELFIWDVLDTIY
jgi:hypothetical protein